MLDLVCICTSESIISTVPVCHGNEWFAEAEQVSQLIKRQSANVFDQTASWSSLSHLKCASKSWEWSWEALIKINFEENLVDCGFDCATSNNYEMLSKVLQLAIQRRAFQARTSPRFTKTKTISASFSELTWKDFCMTCLSHFHVFFNTVKVSHVRIMLEMKFYRWLILEDFLWHQHRRVLVSNDRRTSPTRVKQKVYGN